MYINVRTHCSIFFYLLYSFRNSFGIQHIAQHPFSGWCSDMWSKHFPASRFTDLWGKILMSSQNIQVINIVCHHLSFINIICIFI